MSWICTAHSWDIHSVLALRHSYKYHGPKYSPASLYVGVAFLLEKGWWEVHSNRKLSKFIHTEHLREDKAAMETWQSGWRCDRFPHGEGDSLVKTRRQQWPEPWRSLDHEQKQQPVCETESRRLRPLERPWCQKESEGLFGRKAAGVFVKGIQLVAVWSLQVSLDALPWLFSKSAIRN